MDGQTADRWRWPLPWHEKPLCLSDLGWSTDVTIASSRSRSQPAPHDSSLRSSEGPWHTYKRATLSSTTTITPTSKYTTISLLIMGPNTVNTSPSKARGGEHYYLYSNRIYMKTWETFFSRATGSESYSILAWVVRRAEDVHDLLICGCQSRGYNYTLRIYCLSLK